MNKIDNDFASVMPLIKAEVSRFCNKFPIYSAHSDDLFSEAALTWTRKYSKFDSSRGKLTTFTVVLVRRALINATRSIQRNQTRQHHLGDNTVPYSLEIFTEIGEDAQYTLREALRLAESRDIGSAATIRRMIREKLIGQGWAADSVNAVFREIAESLYDRKVVKA